jgi:hypothetical protein
MDQKRLLLFIAISVAIIAGFQLIMPPPRHVPVSQPLQTVQGHTKDTPTTAVAAPTHDPATPGTEPLPCPHRKTSRA